MNEINESIIARFKKTFLSESPMNIGKGHAYMCKWLSDIIQEFIDNNYKQIPIDSHYSKLETRNEIYYWYTNEANEIILNAVLEKQPFALIVRGLGKDSRYIHQEPFAYELFEIIINDSNQPIRLMSDESLTIDGFKNWIKLFDMGYKIFIYNNTNKNAGQSMKQLKTKEEMEEFFNNEKQYANWQYVISESTQLDNIIGSFGLQRIRELTNQTDRNS